MICSIFISSSFPLFSYHFKSISRCAESGLFNHWMIELKFAAKMRHYEVDERRAKLDKKYDTQDLALKNISDLFYTYLYFIAMAPFLLLLEYMYKLLRKPCTKFRARQFQRRTIERVRAIKAQCCVGWRKLSVLKRLVIKATNK